jgi:hypothetical protein
MKKGKSYRSLYLPAWSIVAAVLTLLLIIAVSTYRNMSREMYARTKVSVQASVSFAEEPG